jgi:uncharacterized protein (TIGR01777 family)
MRVLLAGASGLIGTALGRRLRGNGHDVTTLVRRPPSGKREVQWYPERQEVDRDVVSGMDAVICLSGAGVGDRRWTQSYRRTLLRSRIDTVGTLARTVAGLPSGPRILLSGSAVGYYGDTADRTIDESAPPGDGFLAQLCQEWESAAAPAQAAGIRVAQLRSGIVLGAEADLVRRLRPIVWMGVAGRLGSGRQYLSWISLADEVAAIEFLLTHDVEGPVNLTAPAPVTNAEFIATFGRILHRPTVIPVPAFAMRLVLGELAEDALTGQRALPAKLSAAGFGYEHEDVASALRWALNR